MLMADQSSIGSCYTRAEEDFGGELWSENCEKEAVVKKLFDEMGLEQRYKDYEEKRVGEIRKMIAEVDESEGLKKSVFEAFLGKIYKRTK